jgi:hypothetical protein
LKLERWLIFLGTGDNVMGDKSPKDKEKRKKKQVNKQQQKQQPKTGVATPVSKA